MKIKLAEKIISGGLMSLFAFTSPCVAVSWAKDEYLAHTLLKLALSLKAIYKK